MVPAHGHHSLKKGAVRMPLTWSTQTARQLGRKNERPHSVRNGTESWPTRQGPWGRLAGRTDPRRYAEGRLLQQGRTRPTRPCCPGIGYHQFLDVYAEPCPPPGLRRGSRFTMRESQKSSYQAITTHDLAT